MSGFKNEEIGFYSLTEKNVTYKIYTKIPDVVTEPYMSAFNSTEDVLILLDYDGKRIAATFIDNKKTTIYCNKDGTLINKKQNKNTIETYDKYKLLTLPTIKRLTELYDKIY